MNDIFSELDARLSVITRWVVVNTIKKQSVAEHCFNVERIAHNIARLWFGYSDAPTLYRISQIALHHDDDESITGDLPSPAKNVLSEAYLDAHRDLWYNRDGPEHDVVKLADKMEAYWFLTMESKLGNKYIAEYRAEVEAKVLDFAAKLGPKIEDEATAWVTRIDAIKGKSHGWTT